MQRLSRDREHLHYVFDPAVPPAIEVEPGESFVVETEDAFSGALFEEGVLHRLTVPAGVSLARACFTSRRTLGDPLRPAWLRPSGLRR
jgi:hypothetical protein